MWDLVTQHCVQTCVEHTSEVWSFDISPDETRLIAGSADNMIRLWNLRAEGEAVLTAVDHVSSSTAASGGLIELVGGSEAAATLGEASTGVTVAASTATEEHGMVYYVNYSLVCSCVFLHQMCAA